MTNTIEDYGIAILYEDNHLLCAVKPHGILSQADAAGAPDMLSILKQYIKTKYNKPGDVYLGLVHRLDRPVGGVMAFARTSKAAARLSEQIRLRKVKKTYLTITHGVPQNADGRLEHIIVKERALNIVRVADAGGSQGIGVNMGAGVGRGDGGNKGDIGNVSGGSGAGNGGNGGNGGNNGNWGGADTAILEYKLLAAASLCRTGSPDSGTVAGTAAGTVAGTAAGTAAGTVAGTAGEVAGVAAPAGSVAASAAASLGGNTACGKNPACGGNTACGKNPACGGNPAYDGGLYSLIAVSLITGRPHQIRAQFSFIGNPVLGDRKYGARLAIDGTLEWPALWACSLTFAHPVTNAPLTLTAPPPPRFPWDCYDAGLYKNIIKK